MPRTRAGFHPVRGPRRKKGWDSGPGGTAALALSSSSSAILGSGLQVLVDGQTLIRTRGLFSLVGLTAAAVGDGFQGAFGIGIVSENAFGVGITAVPTPITDVGWDGWLFHHFVSAHAAQNAGSDAANQHFMVDSKAMRKIKATDVIVAVLEVIEIGTASASVFFDSRVLQALA